MTATRRLSVIIIVVTTQRAAVRTCAAISVAYLGAGAVVPNGSEPPAGDGLSSIFGGGPGGVLRVTYPRRESSSAADCSRVDGNVVSLVASTAHFAPAAAATIGTTSTAIWSILLLSFPIAACRFEDG